MNLPPRLLNRAVRIGHTVTLPSGTSGIVVDVTENGFVLDDDAPYQFARYESFPLITMEQLDDQDRGRIASIVSGRRQEFLASLPARLREYVTQPYEISSGNRHAVEALPQPLQQRVAQVGRYQQKQDLIDLIAELCAWRPLDAEQIAGLLGRDRRYDVQNYLSEMVSAGRLSLLHPDMPRHPDQAYVTNDS